MLTELFNLTLKADCPNCNLKSNQIPLPSLHHWYAHKQCSGVDKHPADNSNTTNIKLPVIYLVSLSSTSCSQSVSGSPSFCRGWQEHLMNKVQGTATPGWRWCTRCSSDSHLDSPLLPPSMQACYCISTC